MDAHYWGVNVDVFVGEFQILDLPFSALKCVGEADSAPCEGCWGEEAVVEVEVWVFWTVLLQLFKKSEITAEKALVFGTFDFFRVRVVENDRIVNILSVHSFIR